MIRTYVSLKMPVLEACSTVGISKSTYYWKPNRKKKGKKPSVQTKMIDGTMVDNSIILEKIKETIEPDFHDYGYHLTTACLKQLGYIINKKKVYRLMKEHKLLHPKTRRAQNSEKEFIKYTVPPLEKPFTTVETDIKYIYIQGERRNAFLITFLCTFSRYASPWKLNYTMKTDQIAALIKDFIANPIVAYYLDKSKVNFTIRSDNGPQFISKLLAKTFKDLGLKHEFIHPGTPQENGHIESFHSTIQRLLCNRFEFLDLDHARNIMSNFFNAYNNTRIMSSLCNYPPVKFLTLWNHGLIGIKERNKKQIFFFREKPTNSG